MGTSKQQYKTVTKSGTAPVIYKATADFGAGDHATWAGSIELTNPGTTSEMGCTLSMTTSSATTTQHAPYDFNFVTLTIYLRYSDGTTDVRSQYQNAGDNDGRDLPATVTLNASDYTRNITSTQWVNI